jgi:hypothetical protein
MLQSKKGGVGMLKPKDMALALGVSPIEISKWATEIESSGRYVFAKTTYGSFLFTPEDQDVLSQYQELDFFFDNKKEILLMLRDLLPELPEKSPVWARWLLNAKLVS